MVSTAGSFESTVMVREEEWPFELLQPHSVVRGWPTYLASDRRYGNALRSLNVLVRLLQVDPETVRTYRRLASNLGDLPRSHFIKIFDEFCWGDQPLLIADHPDALSLPEWLDSHIVTPHHFQAICQRIEAFAGILVTQRLYVPIAMDGFLVTDDGMILLCPVPGAVVDRQEELAARLIQDVEEAKQRIYDFIVGEGSRNPFPLEDRVSLTEEEIAETLRSAVKCLPQKEKSRSQHWAILTAFYFTALLLIFCGIAMKLCTSS